MRYEAKVVDYYARPQDPEYMPAVRQGDESLASVRAVYIPAKRILIRSIHIGGFFDEHCFRVTEGHSASADFAHILEGSGLSARDETIDQRLVRWASSSLMDDPDPDMSEILRI